MMPPLLHSRLISTLTSTFTAPDSRDWIWSADLETLNFSHWDRSRQEPVSELVWKITHLQAAHAGSGGAHRNSLWRGHERCGSPQMDAGLHHRCHSHPNDPTHRSSAGVWGSRGRKLELCHTATFDHCLMTEQVPRSHSKAQNGRMSSFARCKSGWIW